MSAIQNKVRGGQRDKDKIVAYKVYTAYQTLKKPSNEKHPYSVSKFFLWAFQTTILRPLTPARNYANLRPRKSNIRRIRKSTKTGKNTIRLYEGKTRESVKAEVRPSGSAGDSASLSLSVQPYYFVAACACLAERVSAPPLVYDKHTPRCHFCFSFDFIVKNTTFRRY